MASLIDIIGKTVKSNMGGVAIPENIKEKVFGGISESILGGLTQTASQPGGLEAIKALLTGKSTAAASSIGSLAGKLFTNGAAKTLNLSSALTGGITKLIPGIVSKLGGILKDQDGDGDVDLQDILILLKGGNSGGGLLASAGTILGGILGGNKNNA